MEALGLSPYSPWHVRPYTQICHNKTVSTTHTHTGNGGEFLPRPLQMISWGPMSEDWFHDVPSLTNPLVFYCFSRIALAFLLVSLAFCLPRIVGCWFFLWLSLGVTPDLVNIFQIPFEDTAWFHGTNTARNIYCLFQLKPDKIFKRI